MLYQTPVIPESEYASFAWNSIISTDSKKLERIQRKFVAVYFLKYLKIHILYAIRHEFDSLF
jgi:hypothetical protein